MATAVDYIHQGQGYGSVAERLLGNRFDINCLRPYVARNGRSYFAANTGKRDPKTRKPIYKAKLANAAATLRYDEWKLFDDYVAEITRAELRLVADLNAGGVGRTIANAMRKTVLQYQSRSDSGNATISMDGLNTARRDRPQFDIANIPIPIIHSDFSFSAREVDVSRNGGDDIGQMEVSDATRKCLELAEGLSLGTLSSFSYANGTIYGLRNHPDRTTFTPTLPTTPGWTPDTLVNEILAALQTMNNLRFRGKFGVYFSPGWESYLDMDYSSAYGNLTLRERLQKIDRIQFMRQLDLLPDFEVIGVEFNRRTIEQVTGMKFMTIQWDSHGGMQLNWKVMGIMFPLIRPNGDGNTGIIHGVAA